MITAEFTVEPFVEGSPGPHVQAAIQIAEEAGLKVEIGPFGNSITGDPNIILPLISSMLSAAVDNGATRISLQVTQV
ncbi:MAG TPA: thiamine-binding protein [Acidimicrobiales bacterium]|nr:thiamine-binding protein [Acidimicrobiales bacterium]